MRPRLLWSSVFGAYAEEQEGDGADAFDTLMRLLAARVNITVAPPSPPPRLRDQLSTAEARPLPLLVDAALATCAVPGSVREALCDFPCAPGIPSAEGSASVVL